MYDFQSLPIDFYWIYFVARNLREINDSLVCTLYLIQLFVEVIRTCRSKARIIIGTFLLSVTGLAHVTCR